MKVVCLIAAAAALMISAHAQDAKVAPPTPVAAPASPAERPLNETEILKFQNSMLQIDRLKKLYKIDEFNEKVQAYSSDQQAEYSSVCKSIGLTDAQIKAQECGLSVGVDLDGKPLMGQDGKPIPSKVWHSLPAPDPVKK